jgi:uncharacterized protein YlxW (UPF0749 family)
MSLLFDVMNHAVEDGYAEAAKRKAARKAAATAMEAASTGEDGGRPGAVRRMIGLLRRRPGNATLGAAVVLALAGALFATAAVSTQRGNAAAKRARHQLVQQVQQQTATADALQREVDDLRATVTRARDSALAVADRGGVLRNQIQQLEQADGASAVDGQGVRVVLDDSPGAAGNDSSGVILDSDLQRAVNGLFQAGAEAVAINRQRLTTQTAIREAGGAILVDYRPLSPPYTIEAIGPPTLGSAFLNGDTGQLFVTEHQLYGLRFNVVDNQRLTLPAAPNLDVRYAKPLETP